MNKIASPSFVPEARETAGGEIDSPDSIVRKGKLIRNNEEKFRNYSLQY